MTTAICILLIIALVAAGVYILALRDQRAELYPYEALYHEYFAASQNMDAKLYEAQQQLRQHIDTIEDQAEIIESLERKLSNLKAHI